MAEEGGKPGTAARLWARALRLPRTAGLLGYLGIAVIIFSGPILSGEVIGVRGDAEAYIWAMRWGPYALAHGESMLYTRHLIWPAGANLMWNASAGPGIVLWPVTALFGSVASYDLLVVLSVALSAWCTQLALRRLVAHEFAAWVGGLYYGCSSYIIPQALGHAALIVAFVPPLFLLLGHELLVRRAWSPWTVGVAAGGIAFVQMMIFLETLALEALAVAAGLIVLAVLRHREIRAMAPRVVRAGASAVVAFGVLAAIPLWVLFRGDQHLAGGVVHEPGIFVTDLVNLAVPTEIQWFAPNVAWATSRYTGNGSEWNGYIGLPVLVLCWLAMARDRRRPVVVVFAAIMAAIFAVLSFGPSLHLAGIYTHYPLPERALARLPLLGNLLPSRLALIMHLFVAVVLASGVRWLASLRGTGSHVLQALTAVAIVGTLAPHLPYPGHPLLVPQFFTDQVRQTVPEGSVALVLPLTTDGTFSDPMAWQAVSGMRFRMPAGYVFTPGPSGPMVGPVPNPLTQAISDIELGKPAPSPAPHDRSVLTAPLADWSVATVIVGPMPNRDAMVSFFTSLLGSPPETMGGVSVWRNLHPNRG